MSIIYYSVEEANEKIKQIRENVERIAELNEEIKMLSNVKFETNNDDFSKVIFEVELNKKFHEKNVEVYTLVTELLRQGCIIRDTRTFEIDFMSKFAGRDVMLCWRKGEENIKYWHEKKENIYRRKPIILLETEYYQELERLK